MTESRLKTALDAGGRNKNEHWRLAFVEDRVLDLTAVMVLERHCSTSGLIQRYKENLVSNEVLSHVALAYKLHRGPALALILSSKTAMSQQQKLLGTAFEAWIGAAWLDAYEHGQEGTVVAWCEELYQMKNWSGLSEAMAKSEELLASTIGSSPSSETYSKTDNDHPLTLGAAAVAPSQPSTTYTMAPVRTSLRVMIGKVQAYLTGFTGTTNFSSSIGSPAKSLTFADLLKSHRRRVSNEHQSVPPVRFATAASSTQCRRPRNRLLAALKPYRSDIDSLSSRDISRWAKADVVFNGKGLPPLPKISSPELFDLFTDNRRGPAYQAFIVASQKGSGIIHTYARAMVLGEKLAESPATGERIGALCTSKTLAYISNAYGIDKLVRLQRLDPPSLDQRIMGSAMKSFVHAAFMSAESPKEKAAFSSWMGSVFSDRRWTFDEMTQTTTSAQKNNPASAPHTAAETPTVKQHEKINDPQKAVVEQAGQSKRHRMDIAQESPVQPKGLAQMGKADVARRITSTHLTCEKEYQGDDEPQPALDRSAAEGKGKEPSTGQEDVVQTIASAIESKDDQSGNPFYKPSIPKAGSRNKDPEKTSKAPVDVTTGPTLPQAPEAARDSITASSDTQAQSSPKKSKKLKTKRSWTDMEVPSGWNLPVVPIELTALPSLLRTPIEKCAPPVGAERIEQVQAGKAAFSYAMQKTVRKHCQYVETVKLLAGHYSTKQVASFLAAYYDLHPSAPTEQQAAFADLFWAHIDKLTQVSREDAIFGREFDNWMDQITSPRVWPDLLSHMTKHENSPWQRKHGIRLSEAESTTESSVGPLSDTPSTSGYEGDAPKGWEPPFSPINFAALPPLLSSTNPHSIKLLYADKGAAVKKFDQSSSELLRKTLRPLYSHLVANGEADRDDWHSVAPLCSNSIVSHLSRHYNLYAKPDMPQSHAAKIFRRYVHWLHLQYPKEKNPDVFRNWIWAVFSKQTFPSLAEIEPKSYTRKGPNETKQQTKDKINRLEAEALKAKMISSQLSQDRPDGVTTPMLTQHDTSFQQEQRPSPDSIIHPIGGETKNPSLVNDSEVEQELRDKPAPPTEEKTPAPHPATPLQPASSPTTNLVSPEANQETQLLFTSIDFSTALTTSHEPTDEPVGIPNHTSSGQHSSSDEPSCSDQIVDLEATAEDPSSFDMSVETLTHVLETIDTSDSSGSPGETDQLSLGSQLKESTNTEESETGLEWITIPSTARRSISVPPERHRSE
ncbi:hypothetical protein I317_04836 [Kwoniella heveanensis CBS 569]|nr:hypothetical protein I317_04836 [Kwoniella heveanensis CBS 569]